MIISASRRTDIPAFHGEWFMERICEGFCQIANPFYPSQVSRVSLAVEDVDAIVFWTKNPAPFVEYLDELDEKGYRYYFLFTLNDYPELMEKNVPARDARVEIFRRLSDKLGSSRVVWRYDPIILSEQMNLEFHLEAFARLAKLLRGSTERVIISFLDFYKKTERRLSLLESETGEKFCRDPFEHPGFEGLVRGLADIAQDVGLELQSCSEDTRLEEAGIKRGKCIDDELINRVFGLNISPKKDRGQRGDCRCVASRDIGSFDSCRHGCEYCYAANG